MSAQSATASQPIELLKEIELLLRNRFRFFAEIRDGVGVPHKIQAMLIWSCLALGLFGAIIGSKHSLWQALASAVKLPLLFLITLLVCLPALYFFFAMFESSLNVTQHLALSLSAVTMMSVVLLALAPVMLFFMVTTTGYQFFKLLNVAMFAVAGVVGLFQLTQGMWMLSANDRRGLRMRRNILRLWVLLFAFVGSQLAWTLRPFFGAPDTPFELFRGLGGNFYTNIFTSLGEVFGFFIVR